MLFKGSGVALVTPFNQDGSVDYEGLEKLVKFHIENETDAIIAIGTTGEASTMTVEERLNVVKKCVEVADGKIQIIAGCSNNNTLESADFTAQVSKLGIDGLLAVTPYYNRANAEGLYRHFEEIAKATDLPIILYSVPGRTNVDIPVELVKRLAEDFDNIQGIKDATGNLSYTVELASVMDEDFRIYSGNDDIVVPLMSVGGDGVISVSANIIPKETHEMCMAYLKGDVKKARDIQLKYFGLIESLFLETNPVPIKEAMNIMGLSAGYYRLPLCEPSQGVKDRLKAELEKVGLI